MRVVGFDPSLRRFGWALWPDGETGTWRFPAGARRHLTMWRTFHDFLDQWHPALAVIEGYAYGKLYQRESLAELGGVLRLVLQQRQVPYLIVAPRSAKAFALSGTATKRQLRALAESWVGHPIHYLDESDAMILAAVGAVVAGLPHPAAPTTAAQRTKVAQWRRHVLIPGEERPVWLT